MQLAQKLKQRYFRHVIEEKYVSTKAPIPDKTFCTKCKTCWNNFDISFL